MMQKSIFWLLTMVAGVAGAAEVASPEFRLPLMRQAPLVDGRIGEAEWVDAIGGFGMAQVYTERIVPIKASFWIGRTADRLYVAGICDNNPFGLRTTAKPRRGNTNCANDDTFEFVFVPDTSAEAPDVRHIIINYSGAYMTQAKLKDAMASWVPDTVVAKSSTEDGRWLFEFSVSLKEIGFADTPADRHALRICRNFKNCGGKWGVSCTIRPDDGCYFSATKTIPVVFDDAAPSVQVRYGQDRGESRWSTELWLGNPTAAPLTVEAKMAGRPVNSQPGTLSKSLTLASGERVKLPVDGPILGDECVELTTDVKVAGKTAFFRSIKWRPNGPKPEWLNVGEDGAVKFDFAFYPSYNKMRLCANLSSIEKRPAAVKIELRSDAAFGRDVIAETTLSLDAQGVADTLWDIPDLKEETLKRGVGGYSLTLTAEGVKNGKVVKSFRRDVFEWEGFKGGTSGAIPPPFTPVEKVGDHVKVVLRDHTVDALGLWKQVVAAGKELLARPMQLAGGVDASKLSATAEWDVDGMMVWRLTLPPGPYEPFRLEIPLKAERAKLLHACADGLRFNYGGAVPSGEGRVWDSSQAPRTGIIGDYLPYIWVGGPLRGIAVFGENDKGWVTDSANARCQEVRREPDGTVTIVLNLVQKPVDIAEARTIKIGFQATPVKPMEKDWRSSDLGTLIGACYYWGGYTDSGDIHPYDGTDTFWRKMSEARKTGKVDHEYIARAVSERVSHCPTNSPRYANTMRCFVAHFNSGMNTMASACGKPSKFVWYTNGRGVRLGIPTGETFADEWTVEPFSERPFKWSDAKYYSLDPNRSFLDFAAYWWEKALSLGVVDYFYWDDIFCQSNYDLVGTDAYRTADGDIQPSSGIFNMREQVKRCAVLQTEHGWISHKNWVHMTNTALAPVLAFAGTNYDWEDDAGMNTLQRRYPRESIQAQSLGRQFGNQVAVMGYFAIKDPKDERLQWLERTGTGVCLTHELRWGRVKAWREAHEQLVKWGYRLPTTKVWNYWDEDIAFPAEVTGGEFASIAMARPDGEALLVISSFEGGEAVARIAPDAAVLGLKPGFKAFDFESGTELPLVGDALTIMIPAYDFKVVRLK